MNKMKFQLLNKEKARKLKIFKNWRKQQTLKTQAAWSSATSMKNNRQYPIHQSLKA